MTANFARLSEIKNHRFYLWLKSPACEGIHSNCLNCFVSDGSFFIIRFSILLRIITFQLGSNMRDHLHFESVKCAYLVTVTQNMQINKVKKCIKLQHLSACLFYVITKLKNPWFTVGPWLLEIWNMNINIYMNIHWYSNINIKAILARYSVDKPFCLPTSKLKKQLLCL